MLIIKKSPANFSAQAGISILLMPLVENHIPNNYSKLFCLTGIVFFHIFALRKITESVSFWFCTLKSGKF